MRLSVPARSSERPRQHSFSPLRPASGPWINSAIEQIPMSLSLCAREFQAHSRIQAEREPVRLAPELVPEQPELGAGGLDPQDQPAALGITDTPQSLWSDCPEGLKGSSRWWTGAADLIRSTQHWVDRCGRRPETLRRFGAESTIAPWPRSLRNRHGLIWGDGIWCARPKLTPFGAHRLRRSCASSPL